MKLITELYDNDIKSEVITESENKKSLYIEGIFLQSDVKNRNGRVYPRCVLENAVNNYIENYVNKNRAIGELNHPAGPAVNPERASHKITELRQEGSNFFGKAKVLNTPIGQIVKALIEDGVRIGVSSRGMGSLKETKGGIMEVQDDFYLATVDIVSDPSAPDAFVNGIMEGVEYIFDNGRLIEMKADDIKKQIQEDVRAKRLTQQRKIQIFEKFMQQISKV
jgi:hypothetical protein